MRAVDNTQYTVDKQQPNGMLKTKRVSCILVYCLLSAVYCFGQINLINTGIDIAVTGTCNVYVDGHITNNATGFVHNNGNIYLTGHWNNHEPSGCLDPTTGTVVLYGGNQFIQGTQTTTFNNLDCQGSGTKTLNINTIAGGSTGVLSLNSRPFDLNSNTLIITNPLPGGITRTSGYIISETPPAAGYGTIQWNLNSNAGNYTYPFGTVNGGYIPFLFNISSAGAGASGDISVSTYPTATANNPNNRPLPTGVTNLDDPDKGKDVSDKCDDRFWIIDANNYTSNPTADLIFTYEDSEWDISGGSTNNVKEDSLKAWRWDGTQWQNPPVGSDNPVANTVSASGISAFSPWTLYSREFPCPLYIPNAFSPNGDNENEVFMPLSGCFKRTQLKIFDRWGEKVFETDDFTKGWDGFYNGTLMNSQVFTYWFRYELLSGDEGKIKGNISLIR